MVPHEISELIRQNLDVWRLMGSLDQIPVSLASPPLIVGFRS